MPSGLPALGRRVVTYDAANPDPPCSVLATLVETRHVYAGIEVVAEYAIVAGLAPTAGLGGASAPPQALPAGWDLAREFLWGERFPEPLAMIDFTDAGSRPRPGVTTGGAETLYYHHDALGSVVALTDAGDPEASPDPIPGKIVERYTYDPYGKTVIESWNGSAFAVENASHFGNPFAWTAQRYDAGVGLYHFLFRSYSPEFGRWLQRDPAGYVDGPNLLEYVRSMPTGLVDPLGLAPPPQAVAVPLTVGVKFMALLGAASTTLVAAMNSGSSAELSKAIYSAQALITEAVETISGFAADPKHVQVLTSTHALLASAKVVLAATIAAEEVVREAIARITKELTSSDGKPPDHCAVLRLLLTRIDKAIQAYEAQWKDHEGKLEKYSKDPYSMDNQNALRDAPNDECRRKIIEGRKHVLREAIKRHKGFEASEKVKRSVVEGLMRAAGC